MKLTEAQRRLLIAMSEGNHIQYSQDGEIGWLWPSNIRLEKFDISDQELQSLRDANLIGEQEFDADEHYRFGPPDIITPAGRAALGTEEKANSSGSEG